MWLGEQTKSNARQAVLGVIVAGHMRMINSLEEDAILGWLAFYSY
jgi:hypothetical protein